MITTSTPVIFDPRSFVKLVSPSVPSHVGLKVTARSDTPVYTCETPTRREVAEENYSRRLHQKSHCGYRSSKCDPYKPIGDVFLDSKELVLSALGQFDGEAHKEGDTDMRHKAERHDINRSQKVVKEPIKNSKRNSVKPGSNPIVRLHTLQPALAKGTQTINKVRLGADLFKLVKDQQKTDKTLLDTNVSMQQNDMIEPGDSTSDGDDETVHSSRIPVGRQQEELWEHASQKTTVHRKETACDSSSKATDLFTAQSCSSRNSSPDHSKRLRRQTPRPFSPVYTNLNLYNVANRESTFRQLCAITWILEAMSQDNAPTMTPIASSWKLIDLESSSGVFSKRGKRSQAVNVIWNSFLTSTSNYGSKKQTQRPARKSSSSFGPKPHSVSTPSVENGI